MSDATKNQAEKTEAKSLTSKVWGFFKDHTKSGLMGVVTGITFILGMVAGFLGSLVLGASLGTALVFSGMTALLSAQGTTKGFNPKKKLTFGVSAVLTVGAISGAFNFSAQPPERMIEVKAHSKYEDVVKNQKAPAIYKRGSNGYVINARNI